MEGGGELVLSAGGSQWGDGTLLLLDYDQERCKWDNWVEQHQNPSYESINQGLAKWALATLELIHAMRVVMVEDELR